MYTFTRITQFRNLGAMMAAMPHCTAIVEHMKAAGQDARLLVPTLGGHPARVLFAMRYESLDAGQEVTKKLMQDPKYREIVAKLGEYVDGSVTSDQTWEQVI